MSGPSIVSGYVLPITSPCDLAEYNFDSPDAFDVPAMVTCLEELKVRHLLLFLCK